MSLRNRSFSWRSLAFIPRELLKGSPYPWPPWKFRWNLDIPQLKRKIIFQNSIIVFHINLQRVVNWIQRTFHPKKSSCETMQPDRCLLCFLLLRPKKSNNDFLELSCDKWWMWYMIQIYDWIGLHPCVIWFHPILSESYMHGTLGPTNKIRWCVSEFELTSTEESAAWAFAKLRLIESKSFTNSEAYEACFPPVLHCGDTRWWQLKYFLFSPRKLGKIPILTNIFQMGLVQPPT